MTHSGRYWCRFYPAPPLSLSSAAPPDPESYLNWALGSDPHCQQRPGDHQDCQRPERGKAGARLPELQEGSPLQHRNRNHGGDPAGRRYRRRCVTPLAGLGGVTGFEGRWPGGHHLPPIPSHPAPPGEAPGHGEGEAAGGERRVREEAASAAGSRWEKGDMANEELGQSSPALGLLGPWATGRLWRCPPWAPRPQRGRALLSGSARQRLLRPSPTATARPALQPDSPSPFPYGMRGSVTRTDCNTFAQTPSFPLPTLPLLL